MSFSAKEHFNWNKLIERNAGGHTPMSISILTAKVTIYHKFDLKKINQNLGLHSTYPAYKQNFSRWGKGFECMLPTEIEKTANKTGNTETA